MSIKPFKKYPSLQAFASYIGTYKGVFWATLTVFALSDIVLMTIPWQIGQLTQSLTSHSDNIAFWTILLIASSAGHDTIWRIAEIMFLKLLTTPNNRFEDFVYRSVLRHPYSFFVDKFTGKISSYTNTLGQEFRELMDNICYQYINLLVSMPIVIITMFSVNLYTGLVFVLCLLLMYFTGRKLAVSMSDSEKVEADKRSSLNGFAVDTVANFVSVKAFGSEKREANRLKHQRGAVITAAAYSFNRALWFWGVMSVFVRWVIWPSTFVLNVYLYTQNEINLAQMTTFLAMIVLFSNYIWEVIWNISQINIKLARVEEAYRYLFGTHNIMDEEHDDITMLSEAAFTKDLELRNVSFAYPDKPNSLVLHDVSLKVKRGEKIGIVGPSGGGKSTLMKLLLGYYPITSGELLLDGKVANNQALTDLIAYVPQDTAVFHRSLSDNIAYGRPNVTQADIEAAARHAQAHDFIKTLDEGYDTLVGERGVKLSGGQRQRIAIARAILKDAPLLMLDEATSALDSESEKLIQKALTGLMEHRTSLVIAHRLSTIQHMDRIVVFDKGTIVEEGNHKQLLEQGKIYAKLWSHQTDGFIED